MKLSEKLELVRAGYSRDEIEAMEAESVPQQAEPAQPVPQMQQPAQQPIQQTGVQEYGGMENLLQQILTGINSQAAAVTNLTTAMQAANTRMGIQDKPASNAGDMATARLINPVYGKEVK